MSHAPSLWRSTFVVLLVFLVGSRSGGAEEVQYNRDVRPLLSDRCFACHGPDEAERQADLRLDLRSQSIEAGAFVPGDSQASLLLERISSADPDLVMPPASFNKPLSDSEQQVLRQWIDSGAEYQRHWAFEPVQQAAIPTFDDAEWCRTPIDHFVLRRLVDAGLSPSKEATSTTLIRRLYLDLVGLLPSPAQVDAFLRDESPNAYEDLVDALLQSEHYGERWGRHWLDQARYADSNGYTFDNARVMWPYRDWVIDALNMDMPFDQFTVEQLAGDLLPDPTMEQLIATGFHRNTLINEEGGTDDEQFRVESVIDRTNTTGAVWLALTVGCAQCHNHKFDPIRQQDYYQFYAFFNSTQDKNNRGPEVTVHDPHAVRIRQINDEIAVLRDGGEESQKRVDALNKERKGLEAKRVKSMVMRELASPRSTHVLIRGDFLRPGEEVSASPLTVLHPIDPESRTLSRLDLARWIVDPTNPLTPRVAVNRVWQRYFGKGLVETTDDFGSQGSPPTHPELLDWLASEFVSGGWSLKRLHRSIVTSAVYRQSSNRRADLESRDPLNLLLGRQNRLRVDAEIVRDLALSAAGTLSSKVGGRSVYPPQPAGVYAFTQLKKNWRTSVGEDRYRRTMYTFFYRSSPHPLLTVFDVPRFNVSCTRRSRSNTPLQSLMVANDAGMFELAKMLADRVLREQEGDVARVNHAFQLCFCRPPEPGESKFLISFLHQQEASFRNAGNTREAGDCQRDAWIAVARVLINLDEFITRE